MTHQPSYKSIIPSTTPRSYLFVPATRTDRIAKALASDTDAVIIDLEDAVSHIDKERARQDLISFFSTFDSQSNKPIWIRINNIEGLEAEDAENFQQDLKLCQKLKSQLSGMVLPKVENNEIIEHAHQATNLPIIIQIETAIGIHNLQSLTNNATVKGLHAISYGKLDLCNAFNITLGSQAQTDFINHLRYQLLLLSKANRLQPPIESIYPDFKNNEGLSKTAGYVADLGFSGMLAIHPLQIESIHIAFAPNEEELTFAKKVVAHYKATGESAYAVDGMMVDLPAIRQCERILTTHT